MTDWTTTPSTTPAVSPCDGEGTMATGLPSMESGTPFDTKSLVVGSGLQISGAPDQPTQLDSTTDTKTTTLGWERESGTANETAPLSSRQRLVRLLSSVPGIAVLGTLLFALASYPAASLLQTALQESDPFNEGIKDGLYYHRERFIAHFTSISEGSLALDEPQTTDVIFVHNNTGRFVSAEWEDQELLDVKGRIYCLAPRDDGLLVRLKCHAESGLPAGAPGQNEQAEGDPRANLSVSEPRVDRSPAQDLRWEATREGEVVTLTFFDHGPSEDTTLIESSIQGGVTLVAKNYLVDLDFYGNDNFTVDTSDEGLPVLRVTVPQASNLLVFDEPEGCDLYLDGVRIPRADEAKS